MENKFTKGDTSGREMVISRLINAPRELVYEVWTNPEHVAKWWGPNGFTNTIHSMDVSPNGKWLLTMHGPDGTDYPNRMIFDEVVQNTMLSYKHDSGSDDDTGQFYTTVTFEEKEGKTLLTMRALFATKEEFQAVVEKFGAIEGGKQTLARLDAYVTALKK